MMQEDEPDTRIGLEAENPISEAVSHVACMGTWRFDYATQTLSWSPGTHHIFGMDETEFDGSPAAFLARVHPEDHDRVAKVIALAEADRTSIDIEFRIVRKRDGAEREVLEHGEIEYDEKGEPVCNAGVIIDITAQRRAERLVRRNATLDKLVGRLARIGGWHIDLGSDTIHWSDTVCAIHECAVGTAPTNDEALRFFVPEHRQSLVDAIASCAERGRAFDIEAQLITMGGHRIWVRTMGEPVRDSEGNISAIQGVLQDLTEQKQSQQELSRHRRQFIDLAESLPVIVWSAQPDGQVDYFNSLMSDYAGMSDLLSRNQSWMETIHPDDMERCVQEWAKAAETGSNYVLEFRLRRRDGAYRWHKVSAAPVRDDNGTIVKWYGAAIDVHDRSELEAEQRALAKDLSTTLESITDAFYTVDQEWRITFVNAEAERLLQRSREELIGRDLWEQFPEARETELFVQYKEAKRSGQKASFELFYEPLSTWFSVNAYPSSSGLAVYFQDVTERRQKEGQLRLLETAMNHLSDFVIMTEIDPLDEPGPRITYVNEALERATGYTPEEVIGKTPRLLQGPETQRAELDRIRHGLEKREPVRAELLNYRKDGSEFWVELEIVPIAASGTEFTHFVAVQRDVTNRKLNEEALRQSEERFRIVSQVATDVIWDWDLSSDQVWMSESFKTIFGHSRSSIPASKDWTALIHPEEREAVGGGIRACIRNGESTWSAEYRFQKADGTYATVIDRGIVLRDEQGISLRMLGGMTDLTEQKHLQDRLQQVQRLEAVGQLTGGVAHDFNNLLTVIMGNAEALAEDLANDRYLGGLARMTQNAAERGAELTQRLLAFARQQALEPATIDVNQVVTGMESLLRRTIRENIDIAFRLKSDLSSAFADQGQLENVILNLVLNARDAIPDGGKITIETDSTELDGDYAANNQEVAPGQYVMIAVTDTGVGMTPEVLQRVFEPFFTTKELGDGNGLGMSMVFGYARQSNGHIKIYSEPDMGTTVRLYLPCGDGDVQASQTGQANKVLRGEGELILVVEDDKMVQDYVRGQLDLLGYQVETADSGDEALEWLKSNATPDLLFTDVVMPGRLNGKRLADAALALRPGLAVLFTSGYTENAIIHQGRLDPGVQLLNKPYSRRELARKIRMAIDRTADGG